MGEIVRTDGLFVQRFKPQPSDGSLVVETFQPNRELILQHNQAMQRQRGDIGDLTFGRFHLSIPMEDMAELMKKYPDLRGDAQTRDRFWKWFIRSPESIKYRVQDGSPKIWLGWKQ